MIRKLLSELLDKCTELKQKKRYRFKDENTEDDDDDDDDDKEQNKQENQENKETSNAKNKVTAK